MHCGVMVTGYNQGDWERLLSEDYGRPPAVSDAANMDDTLYLGELVERLGFDSIWATEHYGSAYSMQPNPLQYLAYWAGRTRRVDVGTAVIVAPWWNPVRLASEISMLATSLPILMAVAREHMLDPLWIGLVWSFAAGGKLFVYQSAVLVVGYSYGFFRHMDMIKIGAALTVVEFFMLAATVAFWWPIIGL